MQGTWWLDLGVGLEFGRFVRPGFGTFVVGAVV